jgi:hypothetical protein
MAPQLTHRMPRPSSAEVVFIRCSCCDVEKDVAQFPGRRRGACCKECKATWDCIWRTAKRGGEDVQAWFSWFKRTHHRECRLMFAEFLASGSYYVPRLRVLNIWKNLFPDPVPAQAAEVAAAAEPGVGDPAPAALAAVPEPPAAAAEPKSAAAAPAAPAGVPAAASARFVRRFIDYEAHHTL